MSPKCRGLHQTAIAAADPRRNSYTFTLPTVNLRSGRTLARQHSLTIAKGLSAPLIELKYRAGMLRNPLIAATHLCLALIAYATVEKLTGRPVIVGHAEAYWIVVVERFSAYGLLGFLFSFLLPGRFSLACGLVVSVAIGLEVLQALTPDRDPALLDVLQKAAGGTVGVLLAQTILAFLPRPPS